MKRALLPTLVLGAALLAAGCSKPDDQFADKAPPAKEGAQAAPVNPNKPSVGAAGTADAGAGMSKPMTKPAGL